MQENIATKIVEAGGKLTVRSALNPMLWLCAIVSIPALLAASLMQTPPIWLIVLICAPVGMALLGFAFLLLFDRDKLQSEEYQLRKRSLELMQQKGDLNPLPIGEAAIIETPKANLLAGDGQ